jgi:replicative DNA helicase
MRVASREPVDSSPLADVTESARDRIEALSDNGRTTGISIGFLNFDLLTGGLHVSQPVVIACRPGHGNSTLAADFLRSCAIKNRQTAALFTGEVQRRCSSTTRRA